MGRAARPIRTAYWTKGARQRETRPSRATLHAPVRRPPWARPPRHVRLRNDPRRTSALVHTRRILYFSIVASTSSRRAWARTVTTGPDVQVSAVYPTGSCLPPRHSTRCQSVTTPRSDHHVMTRISPQPFVPSVSRPHRCRVRRAAAGRGITSRAVLPLGFLLLLNSILEPRATPAPNTGRSAAPAAGRHA